MIRIQRLVDTTARVVPLVAALPYHVEVEDEPADTAGQYIPDLQLTVFAGRNSSRCREDDSVWGLFSTKSDTKTDD